MSSGEAIVPFDFKEILSRGAIADLYHYPIKSCAGVRTNSIEVVATGLRHDRALMLIRPDGKFLSQRDPNCQRLALVHPAIHEGILTVEAPEMPLLYMPITYEGERIETTIHGKPGTVTVNQGEDAQRWFKDFLGFDCRLVAMAPEHTRHIDQEYAVSADDQTGFADGYSVLTISEESLRDLNGRLPVPLNMNRFRPNIVLSGSDVPYGEDRMRRIRIGEVLFTVVKPCSRCQITTTDQELGAVDKREGMLGEPLRTLLHYRAAVRYDSQGRPKEKPMFGQNLVHEGTGVIRVGDRVEVLQLQEPPRFLEKAA